LLVFLLSVPEKSQKLSQFHQLLYSLVITVTDSVSHCIYHMTQLFTVYIT